MERINGNTKNNATGCNNLHESRFKILFFIFRLAGLPIKLKPVSRIQTVYSATIIVCNYVTTVSVFMDTFVQTRNLEDVMKKLRLLIGFIYFAWLHLSFR
jgi:energy-converting hydrogenase Eha subunit F